MTNLALYTTLRCLGINDDQIVAVMQRHCYINPTASCFEEIKHHEIAFIFPNSFIEKRYDQ